MTMGEAADKIEGRTDIATLDVFQALEQVALTPWTPPPTLTAESLNNLAARSRTWLNQVIQLMTGLPDNQTEERQWREAIGPCVKDFRFYHAALRQSACRFLCCAAAEADRAVSWGSRDLINDEPIPSSDYDIPRNLGAQDNTLVLDFVATVGKDDGTDGPWSHRFDAATQKPTAKWKWSDVRYDSLWLIELLSPLLPKPTRIEARTDEQITNEAAEPTSKSNGALAPSELGLEERVVSTDDPWPGLALISDNTTERQVANIIKREWPNGLPNDLKARDRDKIIESKRPATIRNQAPLDSDLIRRVIRKLRQAPSPNAPEPI